MPGPWGSIALLGVLLGAPEGSTGAAGAPAAARPSGHVHPVEVGPAIAFEEALG